MDFDYERPCETDGFQAQVDRWVLHCFGEVIANDQRERADRFIEEALELAQAVPGFNVERAHAIVDYVFGRPIGEPSQEIGGVMVTLAALANVLKIRVGVAANMELARIMSPELVEKIRLKQASKRDIHGPLPT